jgi:hypothetical protein
VTALEAIIEDYPEEEFLKADGFDDAIIGVDNDTLRLVYDSKKAVQILADQFRADYSDPGSEEAILESYQEAQEYFEFNVSGAKGEGYPIWIDIYNTGKSGDACRS